MEISEKLIKIVDDYICKLNEEIISLKNLLKEDNRYIKQVGEENASLRKGLQTLREEINKYKEQYEIDDMQITSLLSEVDHLKNTHESDNKFITETIAHNSKLRKQLDDALNEIRNCYTNHVPPDISPDIKIPKSMPIRTTYVYFGQVMLNEGLINEGQLEEVLHRQQTTMQNRKVGEIAARLGYINKDQIVEILGKQLGVEIVDLEKTEISNKVLNSIDGNIATLYRIIPICYREEGSMKVLTVATADPTNITALDNLSRLIDTPVEPVLATTTQIQDYLNLYYGRRDQTVTSDIKIKGNTNDLGNTEFLGDGTPRF